MKKNIFFLLVSSFVLSHSNAQFSKYIIRFKDKAGTPFTINNPSDYLSARSIARRTQQHIAIDSTDLPVTPRYVDSIQLAGNVIILNKSKWLNQICIQTTDAAALAKINSFPFVVSSSPVMRFQTSNREGQNTINKFNEDVYTTSSASRVEGTSDFYNYGNSYPQIHIHQGEFLHNQGFKGEGMLMAIMDAGFNSYLTVTAFDSVRNNNQIAETYDFVKNETSVNEDDAHGMYCFSIIAGNLPGKFVGTSPKTKFYLYRTEDAATEYPIEEQNWIAAAERADSIGVDIFSTSLGYTTFDNPIFDHTYAELNGKTTMIARANALAAKKGIISVVAAGNDGTNSWHFISTPADADSIVTVGAVTTAGVPASLSSYGPTSDGRIKPTSLSVGQGAAFIGTNSLPAFGNGTSFATPNLAGLITCLWQAFPEFTNVQIIDALIRNSNRYLNPDAKSGYGIPDMKAAFVYLLKKLYSQQASIINCKTQIVFTAKNDSVMPVIIERKLASENVYKEISRNVSTNFALRNITFSDDLTNTPAGVIQYRIKQSISADTTFYLDSLSVNYTQSCVGENISVTPNPVKDQLTTAVSLTTSAMVNVSIYNSTGQKVYTVTKNQQQGTQLYSIPFTSYPKGIYHVVVFFNGERKLTKTILK